MEVMSLLFITRKYPPSRGGMEKVAFELYNHLSALIDVKLVKYGGSNKWLPIVIPYLLARAMGILLTKHIDVIYLEDGLLSPLGIILKLFRKPIVVTIHGRDITYANTVYQYLIPNSLKKVDKVVCVSEAIKVQCLERGISDNKLIIIPNGISDEYYKNENKQILRTELSARLGINLDGQVILFSAGRFIQNKGFHWFVSEVIPLLISGRDYIYIIAGDGILARQIKKIIKDKQLSNSVFLIGWADFNMMKLLYNASDIFIMPNLPEYIEGFGLVALEAASCCLPVVASAVQGIKEAIQDGENGFLVEPGNPNEFITKLIEIAGNGEFNNKFGLKARKYTLEKFGWDEMSKRYLRQFIDM